MEMINAKGFTEVSYEKLQEINGGGKWPWELMYDIAQDAGALVYRWTIKPFRNCDCDC